MPKVGIDPGHGGPDPGAVGPNGLREKEVTLAVSLALEAFLRGRDVATVLTRRDDSDVTLAKRAFLLNAAAVDLVVSVHVNSASDPSADYISTWILAKGGNAERAANLIQAELVSAMKWPNGGVRLANFYILRETEAPAVLVEMGFISNPAQAALLARDDIRQALATAIGHGVLRYFGINTRLDYEGHWAEGAIREALDLGLMHGYPDGSFRPDQPATRAELAATALALYRKLKG